MDLRLRVAALEARFGSAEVDLSSKGYSRIDSTSGTFLVSVKNVQPYLDGSKVTLSVGNLTAATYDGFKIHAKWGPRFDVEHDTYTEWLKSVTEKDLSFTESLPSGWWSTVALVLTPGKPERLGYLELSIETDTVKLLKKKEGG